MLSVFKSNNFIVTIILVFLECIFPITAYSRETLEPDDGDQSVIVSNIISTAVHPYLSRSSFIKQQAAIENLYRLSQQQRIWIKNLNVNDPAEQALRLLASATDSGLKSKHYDSEILRWRWYGIVFGRNSHTDEALDLFDTALSISVIRYLSDLHFGRVTSQQAGFRFKGKVKHPRFAKIVYEAVKNGKISVLASQVEPSFIFYRRLKTALAHYRFIEKQLDNFSFSLTKSLREGDVDLQVKNLQQLLFAFGDLTAEPGNSVPVNEKNIYNSDLVNAVKRFQFRHGLDADGVIGQQTLAALNIPVAARIHKLELALDRLRWLPVMPDKPVILVNIPSFQLWAFNPSQGLNHDSLSMKIVVGEALDWQTPIFNAEMRALYFSPYWNIPRSIFAEEILPKMQQDELYLASQNMELVDRFGGDGVTVAFDEQSFEQLSSGELRIRQRPGPHNALGRIKFMFPNRFGVYMHDTPAKSLFKKNRRDFSHGCIRLENPAALAGFVLKNQAGWNLNNIKKAMLRKNRRVRLKTPIPVHIFYTTALADRDKVFFLDDIYGLDKSLSQAISKRFQDSDRLVYQANSL